jgi:NTP pyrophosphatase (non-canonical NTP hydrolase)
VSGRDKEPPGAAPDRAYRDAETPLAVLAEALRGFNRDRDWEQFHTPKDLAMALSVEASELLELFLWRRDGDLPPAERLAEELGDVLITLTNLASRLDVDLMAAAEAKLALNGRRYPVERARGSAKKYDALGATPEEDER